MVSVPSGVDASGMPAPKESNRDLNDDQVIGLHPQGVINRSLVHGMDKRKHKLFAGLNPGTKHDTPAASVD